MIIDEIKKDNIQAMKDKNVVARNIYGIVVNKYMLQSIEKRKSNQEMTDVDMVAILQKTIKELDEEAENYLKIKNEESANNCLKQKEILQKYLPKMLSEEEIKNIIAGLEDKSIPTIMKHFKSNYAGQVDMQLVNKIARG